MAPIHVRTSLTQAKHITSSDDGFNNGSLDLRLVIYTILY